MYRLTVLPTEELLKMINNYFADTYCNKDNYSYKELTTSCVLATFTNNTTTSIGVAIFEDVKNKRLKYLNNNKIEYVVFNRNNVFYSNVYIKYNVHNLPDITLFEKKLRKMHIKNKNITSPFYTFVG